MAALPPDPGERAVEVRAARFADAGGALSYDVVLTRTRNCQLRRLLQNTRLT